MSISGLILAVDVHFLLEIESEEQRLKIKFKTSINRI